MNNASGMVAVTALLALPLTTAHAGDFFVSGSVGRANLEEDFDGFDVDSDSTAFRLSVGWRFNDFVALEAGYNNFGRFEQRFDVNGVVTDVSLKADGFILGGAGSVPLTESFSLLVRGGSFFWDGDAELNSVSVASPEDTNLYFGVGARLSVHEDWAVTLDAARYELDDTSSNVFSLGFDYTF